MKRDHQEGIVSLAHDLLRPNYVCVLAIQPGLGWVLCSRSRGMGRICQCKRQMRTVRVNEPGLAIDGQGGRIIAPGLHMDTPEAVA
jgi:hypothetical protein